jgi:phosphatidylglycerol phospholipase C
MVWTVNEPVQMMEVSTSSSLWTWKAYLLQATRWGVDAILTDFTKTWLDLRATLRSESSPSCSSVGEVSHLSFTSADYDKTLSQYGRSFLWTTMRFYTPIVLATGRSWRSSLESVAGPFDVVKA